MGLQNQFKDSETNVQSLNNNITELTEKNSNFQQVISDKEQEVDSLKLQIENITGSSGEAQLKLVEISSKIEVISNQKNFLEKEISEKEKLIESNNSELD